MRNLIFEKYSSIDKAWMVSDSCINLFDIDKSNARANAKKWWETEGDFSPNGTGKAVEKLDPSRYEELKNYAVLEAGKSRIIL
jgi:hypothetical protein